MQSFSNSYCPIGVIVSLLFLHCWYEVVADREDTDLAQYFDDCVEFIDEAKRSGGVLVHCFVGRSRR